MISGDEAKYSATVVESFLVDGARQHQTTDQNWDIELRDAQPSITGMHMQVVSR